MRRGLKTSAIGVASALFLSLVFVEWAASNSFGAAHSFATKLSNGGLASTMFGAGGVQRAAAAGAGREGRALPSPVGFRESEGRGLLVRVWVNGAGPFDFALDTGAGASILSPRVAGAARVEVEAGGRGIEVGGLSGASRPGAQKAFVRRLSAGFKENSLPAGGLFIVAQGLPEDLDGILDPTEIFSPLGYVIDFPRGELRVFDPRSTPLRAGDTPPGGAVVRWLSEGGSRRPFVMLAEGRRALVDTGSGYGLAVNAAAARGLGIRDEGGRQGAGTRDLAGGRVASRRVRPATVNIGPLVLRGVPTDLLLNAEKGAPVLLGRDALRPFQLTFDPVNRLIMLRPEEER